MNPKIPCLVVWILFQIHLSGYSQFDFKNFPIDSFALPDIMWRGLELGGSLAGDYNDIQESGDFTKIKASDISSRVQVGFSKYINRPDLQSYLSIYVAPAYLGERIRTENSDYFEGERRFHPDITFYGFQRRYRGKSFFQLGAQASVHYLNSHLQRETAFGIEERNQSRVTGSIQVPFGFGKGRIEPVSDIVMALFLLQDAGELGIEQQNLNREDIIAFAEVMASVRNERVFDTRQKRIHELRNLYDFMFDKGWVIPNDPGYFTVLTDNWLYNYRYPRQAGKRWTLLFTPLLNYSSDQQRISPGPDIDERSRTLGGEISLDFTRFIPQNLFRDFWRVHSIGVEIRDGHQQFSDIETNETVFQGALSNTIGFDFFPNSRTEINTWANLSYTYVDELEKDGFPVAKGQHGISSSLNGRCNYFLTYKTRFTINAALRYVQNAPDQLLFVGDDLIYLNQGSDRLSATFNAGITTFLY